MVRWAGLSAAWGPAEAWGRAGFPPPRGGELTDPRLDLGGCFDEGSRSSLQTLPKELRAGCCSAAAAHIHRLLSFKVWKLPNAPPQQH